MYQNSGSHTSKLKTAPEQNNSDMYTKKSIGQSREKSNQHYVGALHTSNTKIKNNEFHENILNMHFIHFLRNPKPLEKQYDKNTGAYFHLTLPFCLYREILFTVSLSKS